MVRATAIASGVATAALSVALSHLLGSVDPVPMRPVGIGIALCLAAAWSCLLLSVLGRATKAVAHQLSRVAFVAVVGTAATLGAFLSTFAFGVVVIFMDSALSEFSRTSFYGPLRSYAGSSLCYAAAAASLAVVCVIGVLSPTWPPK